MPAVPAGADQPWHLTGRRIDNPVRHLTGTTMAIGGRAALPTQRVAPRVVRTRRKITAVDQEGAWILRVDPPKRSDDQAAGAIDERDARCVEIERFGEDEM